MEYEEVGLPHFQTWRVFLEVQQDGNEIKDVGEIFKKQEADSWRWNGCLSMRLYNTLEKLIKT